MRKVYSKKELSAAVSKFRNWSEVQRELGMTIYGNNRVTLKKYVKEYNIDISHFETRKERYERVNREIGKFKKIPIEEILVENSTYNKGNDIKKRLYEEDLKQPICELCGQDEI